MTLKEVSVFCICRLPWNKDSTAHGEHLYSVLFAKSDTINSAIKLMT